MTIYITKYHYIYTYIYNYKRHINDRSKIPVARCSQRTFSGCSQRTSSERAAAASTPAVRTPVFAKNISWVFCEHQAKGIVERSTYLLHICCIYIYIYSFIFSSTSLYVYIYIYIYIFIHICIYTYIYIYIHINIYMYPELACG